MQGVANKKEAVRILKNKFLHSTYFKLLSQTKGNLCISLVSQLKKYSNDVHNSCDWPELRS